MRDFACPNCGQRLAFENSLCLSCRSAVGFDPALMAFVVVGPDGVVQDPNPPRRMCANLHRSACNWVVADADGNELCLSDRLTRTLPPHDDTEAMAAYADAEQAKRRLMVELLELGLPVVGRDEDPENGLAFDLKSSRDEQVLTGHANGLITLNLAEGDDVHREQLRISMGEPYRTVLGHFRHEIGHYFFFTLIGTGPLRADFEELFGDPDASYQDALDRHYSEGAPAGWESDYVSSYATMHPAEDWAESFAHYLHIRDTVDTAAAFGFAPSGAALDRNLPGEAGFDRLIQLWLPLSWSLNMINRSMGHKDLYPFVLPPKVLTKMKLVHRAVEAVPAS
ncbi:zinc-binding metallopeptidase family protein [Nakamurella deserti]|uniref:zinc-binding metallopeptidase family protein n=1 Tax=Nakamurella deserti TaxID=2164074 RepID=UPI000DBE0571|nr:putative zinc-binding metallopeptidase [Nakamurella deserti]